MKVLFIGDIVGRSGRRALAEILPQLRKEYPWDLCIANAENAAGGKGITQSVAEDLLAMGIDIMTMGNHTWDNKEIYKFIDTADYLIRPANYPVDVPGRGYTVVESANSKVGVVNLSGQVFMGSMQCPFATADEILNRLEDCDYIVLDFHAEATAEKVAMGYYLDGRATAVLGTHTHIQTADQRVLPQGTLYITDVGATAPINSVLGMEIKPVLANLTTKLPQRFTAASGPGMVSAVFMDFVEKSIHRLSISQE